jgi:undecaprenyl-diphosphatase
MALNGFDHSIISFINHACGRSAVFDKTIIFLSENDLFKGCAIMTLYWWVWFSPASNQTDRRQRIVSAIYGCFVAMFVVRILSKLMQFRTRPILDPENHLVQAIGFNINRIPDTHNSFPSDHATLFFALATGMFFVSRRLGLFSAIYVLLFVAFPRIYIGLHYPTDILGGTIVGVFFVLIANMEFFRTKISDKTLRYSETHPGLFYSVFFLLSFQIATLFDSSRNVLHFLGDIIKLG